MQNALPKSEDFFDERRVLGVFRDPAAAEIYSLILAVRKGQPRLTNPKASPGAWKFTAGKPRRAATA